MSSVRMLSLGAVAGGSAHEGLRLTNTTNATPIVATINAGHGLKVGDWVKVAGITGNTGANGEWRVSAVAATTITLEGSVGNGAHGGTPTCRVICDITPFMAKRSAVVFLGSADAYDGVVDVQGSSNDTTYASVIKNVIPAAGAENAVVEVELAKYMRLISTTAGTAGTSRADMMAS